MENDEYYVKEAWEGSHRRGSAARDMEGVARRGGVGVGRAVRRDAGTGADDRAGLLAGKYSTASGASTCSSCPAGSNPPPSRHAGRSGQH